MARSSVSSQCDAVVSYMDGVHVKIAEAYKPPRKVGLPAAYNNKLPDVSKLTYDFSLEKTVLEKMVEWRKVRQANNEARRMRLEEKWKREEEESSSSKTPPVLETGKPIKIVPPPETTILTPQPLSPPANDLQDHIKTNGLDYADFDNDTSSPFDNMELKTINDMEELAQVLQPTSQWAPSTKLENILKELAVDDQNEVQTKDKEESINSQNDGEHTNKSSNVEHRSVSTIIQELQRELAHPIMENWEPWPDLESPDTNSCKALKEENSTKSFHSRQGNPLLDLSEEDKNLAQHLNDMGFPISRAARAIQDLGGKDNKKIVEYLLSVQALEELGIPGNEAEKALSVTEYNIEKAKLYYKNLSILKDLGFPEDQASKALLKCDIDRDKALDYLIA